MLGSVKYCFPFWQRVKQIQQLNILSLFLNSLHKFNKQEAQLLDFSYHTTHFGLKRQSFAIIYAISL